MNKRIVIVGNPGETHVGRHLRDAACAEGLEVIFEDLSEAFAGPRVLRSLCWHLLGKRPQRLGAFSEAVAARCETECPDLVLTTGIAPLNAAALKRLRQAGIKTACFLTDDPWNPQHHAGWFMKALPLYHYVFTPRRANMTELEALNGPSVHYLPFAYAPEIHHPPVTMSDEECRRWASDVLFIGGADEERVAMMSALAEAGLSLSLWGGYWNRTERLRKFAHGHAGPDEFGKLVRNAAVNVCLVRRANRDGHSMRSFELPAVGGCLAVEATDEHREIFGPDGECVRYFSSVAELVTLVRELLADPAQRARLTMAVHRRICENARNTYADRLRTMLEASAGE